MKATVWLLPIVTLLCGSQFVCTAQREYQDFPDSTMMQADYLLEKRTKPSLSIVNPLDVLRQRLLLEIARRQMKENTKQVEINRAILKNVGKRVNQYHRSNDNNFFDYIRRQEDEKNISHMNNLNENLLTPEENSDHAGQDDDYQMRYLYRLHKNRFAKK